MMPAVKHRSGKRMGVVPAVVLAVCAALLVFALAGGDRSEFAEGGASAPSVPEPNGDQPAGEEPPGLALERRDPHDPLADGPVDAPITLVVYSDYQCPFCAAWSHETLPTMREYAEAGELRIEWRDINILSEVSERASIASYAAGLQDRFWEYHEALFPDGETRSASELTDQGLVDLAVELGLDEDRFVEDMAAADTVEAIDRNAQEGLAAGVSGTPAFVLDGQPLLGAQPTQVFVERIEQALTGGG